ncbi:hypothetical protein [Brevundimonas sp. GCM10030266]|uniref:hypothetical protein n=1 Tax=Brevundimonas sp. GCM10030266 TaxID=3273386 RepID=UPI00361729F6
MRAILAALLLLFAALVGVLELVALLDPVGTKMADDGDPFGDPRRSWATYVPSAMLILASIAGATALLRGFRKGGSNVR